MKVHYINILLFSVPLNILDNTHKKPSISPHHIQTTRLLCECELFAPQNYDKDPETKRLVQQFHDRTTQRFQEYDERLQGKRQICKDKCDKEIQKIILKDKIEKELTEKFVTLDTNIATKDIPRCVCKKSLADKTEKFCLTCGYGLGGGVLQSVGLLGGIGEVALNAWKSGALAAAIADAAEAGAAKGAVAGNARGVEIVLFVLKTLGVEDLCPELFKSIGTQIPYYDITNIAKAIITKKTQICNMLANDTPPICTKIDMNFSLIPIAKRTYYPTEEGITKKVIDIVDKAKRSAEALAQDTAKEVITAITKEKTSEIAATYTSWQTTIIASIIAIVVIVLIMVIIYLILRYRRKKKMKKKLQYIKLLEE
ncbi:PIR protein, putative [Plasmodium sp.]|nr:PIR protein, putative [Plasmodium sp.]